MILNLKTTLPLSLAALLTAGIATAQTATLDTQASVSQDFAVYDMDSDGTITFKEYAKVVTPITGATTTAAASDFIKLTNGDHLITQDEFSMGLTTDKTSEWNTAPIDKAQMVQEINAHNLGEMDYNTPDTPDAVITTSTPDSPFPHTDSRTDVNTETMSDETLSGPDMIAPETEMSIQNDIEVEVPTPNVETTPPVDIAPEGLENPTPAPTETPADMEPLPDSHTTG